MILAAIKIYKEVNKSRVIINFAYIKQRLKAPLKEKYQSHNEIRTTTTSFTLNEISFI